MDIKTVSAHPVVRALRPVRPPYHKRLSVHSDLVVWHLDVEFQEWPVPADLASRWSAPDLNAAETWRKRPLIAGQDSGCNYSCGEVEIAARLRTAGIPAYWISEWSGFAHVECWRRFCVKRSEFENRLPQLWKEDQSLRAGPNALTLGRSGGHPDIAALVDGTAFYIEYKGPGDSIKPKQNVWAATAVAAAHPRLTYIAVHGIIMPASTTVHSSSDPSTLEVDQKSQLGVLDAKARHNARDSQNAASETTKKDKLHRRTIADTLKRENGWEIISRVDGWIDFARPRSAASLEQFVDDVRAAVEALGYLPTVRVNRDSRGREWVRVHTPETLAQAGRGAHSKRCVRTCRADST